MLLYTPSDCNSIRALVITWGKLRSSGPAWACFLVSSGPAHVLLLLERMSNLSPVIESQLVSVVWVGEIRGIFRK